MKKTSKMMFAVMTMLILPSMVVNSIVAEPQSAQEERVSFTHAAGGVGGNLKDWDPPIITSNSFGAIETLFSIGKNFKTVYVLATEHTVHERPVGVSSAGNNSGGVEAISFKLREGVKFTDGSDWNATVAKWNIDRTIYISGYNNSHWSARFWYDVLGDSARFSPVWNLTWAENAPFAVSDDTGAPIKIKNTSVPVINRTEIIGEYEIKLYMNKWTTTMGDLLTYGMISMETYEDYAHEAIIGYGDLEGYENAGTDKELEHMVGTGPYKLAWYDMVVAQSAKAMKNENYWNKTALEADGLFVVDDFYTRYYETNGARTQALLSGDADYSPFMLQAQLEDLPTLEANEDLDVYYTQRDASIDIVQFTCEEYLDMPVAALGGMTFRQYFPIWAAKKGWGEGVQAPQGTNRTVRKALSYAFNYDAYMDVAYANIGGGLRAKSPLGTESIYFDDTVPYPVYDMVKARAFLFADPYYAAILADLDLNTTSTDEDWVAVGTTTPIQTFTYIGSVGSVKTDVLEEACHQLGFAMNISTTDSIYMEWMATKKALQFDMWNYMWLNFKYSPMTFMSYGIRLFYNTYMSVPFDTAYNFGLVMNASLDAQMSEIPWQGGEVKKELFWNVSNTLMNDIVPMIYIGMPQQGVVINTKWYANASVGNVPDGDGGGQIVLQWLGLKDQMPGDGSTRGIPGYTSILVLSISFLSMVGLIFIKKRK